MHSVITDGFCYGVVCCGRMSPQENNIQKIHKKELAGRPTYLNYKEEREELLWKKQKKDETEPNQI